MPTITLRFGKVITDQAGLPPIEELVEGVEDKGIYGYETERRGADEYVAGEDYVYMRFVKEVPETVQTLTEDEDIIQSEEYFARVMRFLLLADGTYAFESRRGVSDKDAIEYLFEDFNLYYEFERYSNLTLDHMRKFYKSRKQIKKIKVKNIGKRDPNPHWPDEKIMELVQETGEETDNSEFSVGRNDNNLKNVELINKGFARLSELPYIKAKDAEGDIQILRDSGRFGYTYSADLGNEEQSQRIRDTAIGLARNLFISNDRNDEE
jgi:hypothetical protein